MSASISLAGLSAVTETAFDQSIFGDRLECLAKTAQAGDDAAHGHLLRECIPFIKFVARRSGVPHDYVDDVVQETLIAIHRFRLSYDPTRPFGAWLRTIARRRAIDVMRSISRTSLREVHEPLAFENHSDPAHNPEEETAQVDRLAFATIAIASLPAKQRQAVEQITLKGRSLLDAAVATGLTPGALKVNLHRALNTLRARSRAANSNHHVGLLGSCA
jgi:RNA polymerase sigma factor (sigma-70 family)